MGAATGRKVGNFRLERSLGSGGMGVVYLAQHERIERQVAVKVLHAHLAASTEMVERFFNEALASNRIRHEGIVEIFDCGRDDEVGVYLVMERLEGETLDEHLDHTEVGLDTTRSILGQVAEALVAVHEHGIVHRDLKPGNIFVLEVEDEQGREAVRTKLLDFGTAKLRADSAAGVFTRAGDVIGTPRYMSPEQYKDSRGVDHRTDIYSLGLIAYRLLCGRGPFDALSGAELVHAHLFMPPDRPSRVNPGLPPEVDDVLLRALAKSPDDRFATMSAFAAALAHVLGALTDESTPARSAQAVRRPPGPASVGLTEPPAQVTAAATPRGLSSDSSRIVTREFTAGLPEEELSAMDLLPAETGSEDGVPTPEVRPPEPDETRPLGSLERLAAARVVDRGVERGVDRVVERGGERAAAGGGHDVAQLTQPALRRAAPPALPAPPSDPVTRVADRRAEETRSAHRRWPVVPALILTAALVTGAAVFYQLAKPPPVVPGVGLEPATGLVPLTARDAAGGLAPITPADAALVAVAPDSATDPADLAAQDSAPSVPLRRLWLTTRPDGARVMADGELLGHTPLEGVAVGPDVLSVMIEKRGYADRELPLHRGSRDLRYSNVGLRRLPQRPRPPAPSTAALQVVTLDGGQMIAAEVYVDGRRVGESPLYLARVTAGVHRIAARRAGFAPASKRVRLSPRRANRIVLRLKRMPR